MPNYIDFSWKVEGGQPLTATQLQKWESIIHDAMGGSGWVVMRQVKGVWYVDEARVTVAPAQDEKRSDRRTAVPDALRRQGITVEISRSPRT